MIRPDPDPDPTVLLQSSIDFLQQAVALVGRFKVLSGQLTKDATALDDSLERAVACLKTHARQERARAKARELVAAERSAS